MRKHHEWIHALTRTLYEQREIIRTLNDRVKHLETKVKEQDIIIEKVKKQTEESTQSIQPNLEIGIKKAVEEVKKATMAEVVGRGLSTCPSEFEINLTMANNKEKHERAKREKNVIIFGLSSTENREADREQVNKIFQHLQVPHENVKRVARLTISMPATNERPAPVLVELMSSTVRDEVLKVAKRLKQNSDLSTIFIAPDLTPNERLVLKRDREVCRDLNSKLSSDSPFFWQVRDGIKTRIDKVTKRVFKQANAVGSSTKR